MSTNMSLDEAREIIAKFNKEEAVLDQQLIENKLSYENDKNTKFFRESGINTTFEEAVYRNTELLKELELTKGRLRSKAIFSPTEVKWEHICTKYQENPSLPITTWRCHLPVFV